MKKIDVLFLVAFGSLECIAVLATINLRLAMLAIATLGVFCYVLFRVVDFLARKMLAFGAAGAAGLLGYTGYRLTRRYLGGAFQPSRAKIALDELDPRENSPR